MKVLSGLVPSVLSKPSVMNQKVGSPRQRPHPDTRPGVYGVDHFQTSTRRVHNLTRGNLSCVNLNTFPLLKRLPQRTLWDPQLSRPVRVEPAWTLPFFQRVGQTCNIVFGESCGD